ncbi:Crp-like helix-turn-helix domain-containing protein [Rhodospirillales bacterium URHD0017]|nr:Crp-like helix-turn-helix domain-containing protein [Rhodospirillales bacterium URHD0017]
MLGLGGIRRWKQREIMFRAGDPIGSFFKIRRGIAAVSLGLDDGRERVAHFLAEFDAADSERSMPESSLALQIRRREIADYLGITVETLSRSLSQLRKRNVVRSNVDEIVVLDDERLCEIGKVSRPKSRSA